MGCDECNGDNAIYVTVRKKGEDGETSEVKTPICPYIMEKGDDFHQRGERITYETESMILSSYKCLLGNGNSRTAKDFKEFEKAVKASRRAEA